MAEQSEKAIKNREVRAFGFVGAEAVRTLTEKLSDLVNEDAQQLIRLPMACYGSAWISAQAFYDYVRTMAVPLETCALGSVEGAALLVFAAGRQRLAAEGTVFAFERYKLWFEKESLDVVELAQKTQIAKDLEWHSSQSIAAASGLSTEAVLDMFRRGAVLSVEEALDQGLVTGMLDAEGRYPLDCGSQAVCAAAG